MKTVSSILFASRLLFPRTGKKSNARKSLMGACICIGISLIPLVLVMSVSNGMIQGITERIIGLSSNHIQCHLFRPEDYINDENELERLCSQVQTIKGVTAVYPEIQGIGLASSIKGRTGATIRAVERDSFEKNNAFAEYFKVVDGTTDLSRQNSVVLGKKLAEDLNIKAGGTIRLITTRDTAEGKSVPKITSVKVSGIVSCGYQELDALWVFISLETGKKIMSASSSNVIIGIQSSDAFGVSLENVYWKVKPFLSDYGRLYRWDQLNSAQYENFASTQIMLIFIMMLIVLVASVNISSALVMLVIERKKEIAIIKSLGGTSRGISFAFIITGFFTGLTGVLAGIPLGLLLSVNFNSVIKLIEKILNFVANFAYFFIHGESSTSLNIHLLDPAFYLQDVPLSIPLSQLLIISIGTLVLSLLVSAIPAYKAGKEKPIETLRKI